MTQPLIDNHDRVHDYLRVSLVERCNLRCRYCMPEGGVDLTPDDHLCTTEELMTLIDLFIELGVRRVRLTGGEPLLRKDVRRVISELSQRDVELALTTNGLLVHKHIDLFKDADLKSINVSLDTLKPARFERITRRNGFEVVMRNIKTLMAESFQVKVNAVILDGVNEDELIDFVEWTRNEALTVRFIEFMPFDGNRWNDGEMLPWADMKEIVEERFTLEKRQDGPNDTTKHYSVPGFRGQVGFISSMSEHFCGSCNRIRLLANGAIKNCLFSQHEADLLTPLRAGQDVEPIIRQVISNKKPRHAGMFNLAEDPTRSMVTIGG